MVRMLTEDQENLAAYTWMLSQHRLALAKQLADVEEFEREAIRSAEQYGVKQKTLAALTGRSPGRISQIISESGPKTGKVLTESRETWRRALDEPQEHLALHEKKFTTAETIATWNTNFNLVHGEDNNIF
ncbi:hypothetical protein [Arthrobacter alpinus]|uniref:hypothetical protein n=1 Tax=Arthrobacter alpinus TaxID=656366 RepID=UPI0012FEBB8F|nr:hypothetical protein [Arthrobacter alpinus]